MKELKLDEIEESLLAISDVGGACLQIMKSIDHLLETSTDGNSGAKEVREKLKEHKKFYQAMVMVGLERFDNICKKAGLDPVAKSCELENKIESHFNEYNRDVGLL